MKRIREIVNNLDGARVIIIGDLMLDKFIQGKTERISPEAPVQVVSVTEEKYFLGGAANTARNVASLGGSVCIIGIIGNDNDGETFKSLLDESKIDSRLVYSNNRPTIKKVRIISQGQQLIRFDYEKTNPHSSIEYKKIKAALAEIIDDYDYIIVSDYAKGLIVQRLFDHITGLNKKIIVDPKPRKDIKYRNSFLIKPNLKESKLLSGVEITQNNYSLAAENIKKITGGHVLLTLGEDGMYLSTDKSELYLNSQQAKVYDVTGAGDTVIAALASALSVGATLEEATEISNYAAAVVIHKQGTATTTREEILEFIEQTKLREKYASKIH